jgi:transglutaminase-like putative cysteine protease
MKTKILHKTEYKYSEPVYVEPHILRLTPRTGHYTSILESNLKIFPEPVSISYNIETDGSVSCLACFNSVTDSLSIEQTTVVKTQKRNPFSFLIYPNSCLKVPFIYPLALQAELSLFKDLSTDSKELYDFSYYLAESVDFQIIPYLTKISETLNKNIKYEYREMGQPRDPVYTFETETGSCRDIVQLFMELCRYMNLATRFVSGYYCEKPDSPDAKPELHAWAEVYIPGGGWVGIDPTLGLVCHGYHVALSTSAFPEQTLPVSGTYRGSASSVMKTFLEIENKE